MRSYCLWFGCTVSHPSPWTINPLREPFMSEQWEKEEKKDQTQAGREMCVMLGSLLSLKGVQLLAVVLWINQVSLLISLVSAPGRQRAETMVSLCSFKTHHVRMVRLKWHNTPPLIGPLKNLQGKSINLSVSAGKAWAEHINRHFHQRKASLWEFTFQKKNLEPRIP